MVDYDDALSRARKAYSESIGAPKIPNVTWDDVGGLAKVKGEVLDTIQLPLDHPELFGGGLKKRSGNVNSSGVFSMSPAHNDLIRCASIRPSWNGKDARGESGRNILFSQLPVRQGTRAPQHVHRRIRGQRTTYLPAGPGCQAMRHFL
jgi:hypothetical protein